MQQRQHQTRANAFLKAQGSAKGQEIAGYERFRVEGSRVDSLGSATGQEIMGSCKGSYTGVYTVRSINIPSGIYRGFFACDYVGYSGVFLGLIGLSLRLVFPKPLGLGLSVGFRG